MNLRQQGFSIIMATFILVVLGLLGGYMARFSGVQQVIMVDALQGARAYQAARAGLGWAIASIQGGGACAAVNAQTAFTLPAITGFSVVLTCTSQTYHEGDKDPIVYTLSALSEYGAFASNDYVSRQLEVSIVTGL